MAIPVEVAHLPHGRIQQIDADGFHEAALELATLVPAGVLGGFSEAKAGIPRKQPSAGARRNSFGCFIGAFRGAEGRRGSASYSTLRNPLWFSTMKVLLPMYCSSTESYCPPLMEPAAPVVVLGRVVRAEVKA